MMKKTSKDFRTVSVHIYVLSLLIPALTYLHLSSDYIRRTDFFSPEKTLRYVVKYIIIETKLDSFDSVTLRIKEF